MCVSVRVYVYVRMCASECECVFGRLSLQVSVKRE